MFLILFLILFSLFLLSLVFSFFSLFSLIFKLIFKLIIGLYNIAKIIIYLLISLYNLLISLYNLLTYGRKKNEQDHIREIFDEKMRQDRLHEQEIIHETLDYDFLDSDNEYESDGEGRKEFIEDYSVQQLEESEEIEVVPFKIDKINEEKTITQYNKMDYYHYIFKIVNLNLVNDFKTRSLFSDRLRKIMGKTFSGQLYEFLPFIHQNIDYMCKNHGERCGIRGIKNFIKDEVTTLEEAKQLFEIVKNLLEDYC